MAALPCGERYGGDCVGDDFGLGAYFFGRQFTHVIGPLSLAAFAVGAIVVIGAALYLRRHEAALTAEAERALPGPVGRLRRHHPVPKVALRLHVAAMDQDGEEKAAEAVQGWL